MAAFFTAARLMLKVACPGARAWNVRVKTDPSPVMPGLPGGREAVSCRMPTMLSSRFTSATVCPSCDSSVPLETFTSCNTRGLYVTCTGTEYTFWPPVMFTFTVNVEPTTWSMLGGSKLTIALPRGAEAADGCTAGGLGWEGLAAAPGGIPGWTGGVVRCCWSAG